MRFFCATYGGAIAGVRVNEEGFLVFTADPSGEDRVETTITVGPDGTCACRVSTAHGQAATVSPDTRSFERVLADRLADVGVRARTANHPG